MVTKAHFTKTIRAVAVLATLSATYTSSAATINAASCEQSAVQSAISSASDGDVVSVPAGNCSWGSFTISKGIHLRGAGSDLTKITMTGSLTLNKSRTRSVELSGFSFSKSGGGGSARILYVNGAWDGEPPLIHDNVFTVASAGAIRYQTNGGVIYRNVFRGNLDDSGIQHKVTNDSSSWSTADTMGIRDTDGKRNLYIEDNVFEGMAAQATDFDDSARVVFRHNTMRHSSFNSHGLATSPVGVRHYEIYNNSFLYPSASVNQNWHIWLRGGTGVIFNNQVQDITGSQWGDKAELQFSVRAAVDGGVEGCCRSWPCKHQVGQNHDGTRQFTDPVQIWGNTGILRWARNGGWTNTCGNNMADFLQEGRDFVFSSSPKSGYTPYPYPHPLRQDVARPAKPENLIVVDP